MATTVRLPHRIEQALASHCARTRRTKSEVIVELLERHLLEGNVDAMPYEHAAAAGFVGCVDGDPGAAENAKQLVRDALRAKHSR